MRNYIKSELYRNLLRPYYINFNIGMCILVVLGVLALRGMSIEPSGDYSTQAILFSMGKSFLRIPVYLCIFFIEIVMTEDKKNGTLKNVVASGLDRGKLVVGKIISATLLAMISAMIILLAYFLAGFIFLDPIRVSELSIIGEFIYSLIAAYGVWVSCIVLGMLLSINIKSDILLGVVYVVVVSILPGLVNFILTKIFSFQKLGGLISRLSLANRFDKFLLDGNPGTGFSKMILLSAIYIVVLTVLAIKSFRAKDL